MNASEWIDTDDDGEGNADADDDNDGLLDQQEIRLGTNELLADTDGDGMDDGLEDGGLTRSTILVSDMVSPTRRHLF